MVLLHNYCVFSLLSYCTVCRHYLFSNEDYENLSVRSQSPEKCVKDDTDNTSKVDILRKKVKSPKSIASRIKDYSKKIGDKAVKYSISGPLPDYDIVGQAPKSDMTGFLSPRAKQDGFIPWHGIKE